MNSIEQLYNEWKSLQPLKQEDQKRWDDKFKLEFNYNSNHLEGNTLTYGQTKLLFMFGETSGNASLKDYEEMKAHNVGLEMVKQEAQDKERPLTESFIRELNRTILVQDYWKNAKTPDGQDTRMLIKVGEYKSRPNSVITTTGETFNYASPEETMAFMSSLVSWYNQEAEKGMLSPIELAALLHYRYIRIHPFEDGNGRIARLLVNFVLYRYDYPMIIIHTEDKSNYLNILHQCDVEVGLTPSDGANAHLDDIRPFIEYLNSCLSRSLKLSIKAAKGESIEEEGDFEKRVAMLQHKYSEKANKKNSDSVEQARNDFYQLIVYSRNKANELNKLFDKIHSISSFIDKQGGVISVEFSSLQQDNVTFNMEHCRYTADKTFTISYSIFIRYLADGCELGNSLTDKIIKQPYNHNSLLKEGKEYIDYVFNVLLALIEEKIQG